MIAPTIAAIAWQATAFAASRAPDTRMARRSTTRWATGIVAVALSSLAIPGEPAVPLIAVCLSGLLITALTPAAHSPTILSRALRIVAVSCALLAIRIPGVDVGLWLISIVLVWSMLRDRPDGLDRLFVLYQIPAVVFLGLGEIFPGPVGDVFLLLAVAARLAVFPLHSWFPRFVARAPLSVVVAYLSAPMPLPSTVAAPGLGAVTALLAAWVAVALVDARRSLAYLLISAHGLVLAGADQSVALVATAGLTMTVAILAARREPLTLGAPGGDLSATPRMAFAYLIFAMALAGFPLLPTFADEHRVLASASPFIAVAVIGAQTLAGITAMRGFLGLFTHAKYPTGERDLTPLENYALAATLAALLVTGLAPSLLPPPNQQVTANR
ncbi:hypothetical protein [Actinokineospora enzanensis]|uniref:hypothetical protein n=1 Tax=Actinokineospora enzanensis TaxID=155975 RepID=UPI000372A914|nr:hypothetical protein [Actinokineospora enzanensis]